VGAILFGRPEAAIIGLVLIPILISFGLSADPGPFPRVPFLVVSDPEVGTTSLLQDKRIFLCTANGDEIALVVCAIVTRTVPLSGTEAEIVDVRAEDKLIAAIDLRTDRTVELATPFHALVNGGALAATPIALVVSADLACAFGRAITQPLLAHCGFQAETATPIAPVVSALLALTLRLAFALACQAALRLSRAFSAASSAAIITALLAHTHGSAHAFAADTQLTHLAGREAAALRQRLMDAYRVGAPVLSAIVFIVAVVEDLIGSSVFAAQGNRIAVAKGQPGLADYGEWFAAVVF